ncbi:cytochrome P450 [Sistotremastrum suecicum HHB10207 ss-3]|uniref:Cytochrome P450 n=1 Tax=Sistotremastrum suecicum HHB10207 ss-3 TaxID=1314776 RepID=A0A166GSN7_9AGAM|nr:cytochrome P450 [Sistotremastrum suecicum HHB10207 ss-3]
MAQYLDSAFLLALSVVGLVAFKWIISRASSTHSKLPLPPGPKLAPIVGNLFQFPRELPWIKYREWGLEYGDVVYLRAINRNIILINSHQAALDLLEHKSVIFSSRPHITFASDMCGFSKSLVLTPYNARMRASRKHFHSLMSPRHTPQYWSLEESAARRLARSLYDDLANGDGQGEQVFERIKWTTASVAVLIAYGYTPSKEHDPLLRMEEATSRYFEEATAPGGWIVDEITVLKYIPSWFPFTSFQRTAAKWRREVQEVVDVPFETVRNQMTTNSAPPSFVRKILEGEPSTQTPEEIDILKWTAGVIFSAGTETTASAIYSYFLAMVLFPKVQERAQAELDAVIGTERMPGLADRQGGKLVYVEALVKEIMRWAPIAPLGVVHLSTKEYEYRGWRIPDESMVVVNVWGIFRDPSIYPLPEEFRPERFLTKAQGGDCESTEDIPLDPREVVFGYGRRNCPGQHLADLALWIAVATILSVYHISAAPDSDKMPSVNYTSGVVSHPKPFKCAVRPRSEKAKQLILEFDDSAVAYMAETAPFHVKV